jgi:ABC-type multidrug transport system fused ATPase/permease subunit
LGIGLAVLLSDMLISLGGAWLRRGYVSDMLAQLKNTRMGFLFHRKQRVPNEDNTKDLSFFTADADILDNRYYNHLALLPNRIALFVFALGAMLWIDWIVTVVALGVSMLPMLASGIFAPGLQRRTKAYSEAAEDYVATVKECVDGRREIVAYDKQDVFAGRHAAANRSIERARFSSSFFERVAGIVPGFMGGMVQVAVMGVSCYFVITGRMTFGFMVAIVQLMNNVFGPVQAIIEAINNMRSTKDIREKAWEKNPPAEKGEAVSSFNSGIEIRGLGLKYEDGEYVLQGLDLNIKKGGKYAVFAPSGYGKTSVARALAMEFADFDGAIKIDGRDIRSLDTHDYHKILRYVRQDPYLFSDTAVNNITFFEPPPPREELERVLAVTRVREFLPDDEAMARPISNSSGLSGGQKQRLVLARALLHRPKILVLDEITSGVDLDTACLILQDIFQDKELTVVAITHENDRRFQSLFDEVLYLSR